MRKLTIEINVPDGNGNLFASTIFGWLAVDFAYRAYDEMVDGDHEEIKHNNKLVGTWKVSDTTPSTPYINICPRCFDDLISANIVPGTEFAPLCERHREGSTP